jgi:hypothetical protein
VSVLAFVFIGAGALQFEPASSLRTATQSPSAPTAPAHATSQLLSPSFEMLANQSCVASPIIVGLRSAAALHVAPLFVLRANARSPSVPLPATLRFRPQRGARGCRPSWRRSRRSC